MSLESNSKWVIPKKIQEEEIVKYLLKSRNISETDAFLEPSLDAVPSFDGLYDTQTAAIKILEYIKLKKRIVIHGDYDCDGICATALLWTFLYRDLSKFLNTKVDVIPYIPSRIDQGYGLTESSLDDVLDLGAKLLISVDCGVRDKENIKKYRKKGLGFVITDHHQPPEDIQNNLDYPLVHQLYPGHEYPDHEICGTTVAFLLIQSIKKEVGMNFKVDENTEGLDLVALSTVTDLMPLVNSNRVLVTYGLKQIQKGKRLGLRMLTLRAGIEPKDIDTYHLGYILGPRINAAGRIGSPLEAVKLLVSTDEELCKTIANDLNDTNFSRQEMTSDILNSVQTEVTDTDNLIFVLGKDWHEGIIGLVAGKLQEKYYKPVIVATENHGEIRGSARSIKGFNITKTLEKYRVYLERFGGHELAAGFTVKGNEIENFRTEIIQYANKEISKDTLQRNIHIDLNLETEDINFRLMEILKQLEPYGYGNPKPLIYLSNLIVLKKYTMGKDRNHLKLTVKGGGIEPLTLILFNCFEDTEKINENDVIDVIGYPNVNIWNGNENMQFQVKEWKYYKS